MDHLKVILCFYLISFVNSLPASLLYDYTSAKRLRNGDDVSSSKIKLQVPIVFYGVTYNNIYVSIFYKQIKNFAIAEIDLFLKFRFLFFFVLAIFF